MADLLHGEKTLSGEAAKGRETRAVFQGQLFAGSHLVSGIRRVCQIRTE